jgi:DNA-binding transcriptional regulator YhcF (GntR family)
MVWSFQADRPIYLQLKEQIKLQIVSGQYPPGSKLPAVRDLAEEAAVNPNTLQKALSELEREGLVYTQRTSGRYVTEDEKMIGEVKTELALEQIDQFFKKMEDMGYGKKEILELLKKSGEGKN